LPSFGLGIEEIWRSIESELGETAGVGVSEKKRLHVDRGLWCTGQEFAEEPCC